MALDLPNGKIYWAEVDAGGGTIRRANLVDGSNQEILITRASEIPGIALDIAAGKMYWTEYDSGKIGRANLDGTDAEYLVTGLNGPVDIALQIEAPPVSSFLITAAPTAVAGMPFDITVTAVDASGNIDSAYQGTVSFSSTDPYAVVLPATYTFTARDQGTHSFRGGVTLFTAGTQTLTVQDTATSSLTGSATVAVVAAPASQLQVTAPATAVSGTAFDVLLAALDPYGNMDMNYGGTVTWISSDPNPGVLLPAAYTFQPTDNGRVTFPGAVMLITLGNQTITATDTVSGITGSATLTVGP
jgi:hypothetical protein